jgi:hypothetical protein|nr:MAG TPA: hypothetical protein [Caudoviricetes sp.]
MSRENTDIFLHTEEKYLDFIEILGYSKDKEALI